MTAAAIAVQPAVHLPAVSLMGIRHHGPGSARSVVRVLNELQPDVVLVELPADCEGALTWVGHQHLVPPKQRDGWN